MDPEKQLDNESEPMHSAKIHGFMFEHVFSGTSRTNSFSKVTETKSMAPKLGILLEVSNRPVFCISVLIFLPSIFQVLPKCL